jgi:hypothetical protein
MVPVIVFASEREEANERCSGSAFVFFIERSQPIKDEMEKAYSMHDISNAYITLFGRTCREETNFNTKARVAAWIQK